MLCTPGFISLLHLLMDSWTATIHLQYAMVLGCPLMPGGRPDSSPLCAWGLRGQRSSGVLLSIALRGPHYSREEMSGRRPPLSADDLLERLTGDMSVAMKSDEPGDS